MIQAPKFYPARSPKIRQMLQRNAPSFGRT